MSNTKKCDEKDGQLWISYRLWLALFFLIGFATVYSWRVGMSVAIISMVNHTALQTKSISDHNLTHTTPLNPDGEFVWSKEIQGHILGSFYYGYLISQVPCGWMAEQYGCKKVLIIFLGLSSFVTLITPFAAKFGGHICLIIIRIFAGIGAGAALPCMANFWSKWAPPDERSKLTSITYSGSSVGIVIAMPLSGILCSTVGWESVFYVTGGSTFIWLILCCILISDDPTSARFISSKEKLYIISKIQNDSVNQKKQPKTPWIAILTSPVVWGVIIANIVQDWGINTYRSNIPTYFYEVFGFDITSNGFYSALPFIGCAVMMNIAPIFADYSISKNILSIRITRIVMTSIGFIGPALLLICLTFIPSTYSKLAVAVLTIGVSLSSFSQSGMVVTPLDIAPNFAGTITGFSNGFAALSGIFAPFAISKLTKNQTNQEWSQVFYITAAIYAIGTILFGILNKGKIQPWARNSQSNNDNDELDILSTVEA